MSCYLECTLGGTLKLRAWLANCSTPYDMHIIFSRSTNSKVHVHAGEQSLALEQGEDYSHNELEHPLVLELLDVILHINFWPRSPFVISKHWFNKR